MLEADLCSSIEEYVFELMQSLITKTALTLPNIRVSSQTIYISSVIYRLAISKRTCTLRSIFYRSLTSHAGLLPTQATVSKCVELVRCSLACTRRSIYQFICLFLLDLGVFATAKGLITCGDFNCELFSHAGQIIDVRRHADGLIVSADISDCARVESDAGNILIVEKDTIFHVTCAVVIFRFQHLAAFRGFLTDSKIILVTAKGFPDEATIDLLKCIVKTLIGKIYYLGDLDPYGLAIYLNYKKRLGKLPDGAAIEWLGLKTEDVHAITTSHGFIPNLGIQVTSFTDKCNLAHRER